MRIICTISILLLSLWSSAQSATNFIERKGYLVSGMNTLELGANREGPWQLSPAVAVRYGLVVTSGYDARLDLEWSTLAIQKWYEDLLDRYIDSSLVDYAIVYGPSQVDKIAYNALAYERWLDVLERWKKLKTPQVPTYTLTGELELVGPIYWEDLKSEMNFSREQWKTFQEENPAVVGERLDEFHDALVRIDPVPDPFDMEQLNAFAKKSDSTQLADLMASRNRIASNIPDPSTHTRVTYRVRSGDVLGSISQRYRVKLSDVKKWNNMRSDVIRVGQELTIYVPRGVETAAVTAREAEQSEGSVRSDEEGRTEVQYRIKTGDTLWSIARNYPGVSAEDIMRWNGIKEDIKEGQVILILTKASTE